MLILISAMSKNRVIGKNNTLPWHISADLKRFKQLTAGHTVVMGRKTYDSIGRLLPQRVNHIISSTLSETDLIGGSEQTSGQIFFSLSEWMEWYAEHRDEEIYVIGGGMIYEALLPYADRIELTRIDATVEGDVYFPEFEDQFILVYTESQIDEQYSFEFLTYERK